MASAKCFCDDCQAAAAKFHTEYNAHALTHEDGGTPFDLYRNDRYAIVVGEDKLVAVKCKSGSITNRNMASCCNTVLFASFDRGPHWISVYRDHIVGGVKPVDYYIQTKFAPLEISVPSAAQNAPSYPPGMMFKLMFERLKMGIGF